MKRWLPFLLTVLGAPWFVAATVRVSESARTATGDVHGFWPLVLVLFLIWRPFAGSDEPTPLRRGYLGLQWLAVGFVCLLMPLPAVAVGVLLAYQSQRLLGQRFWATQMLCPFLALSGMVIGLLPALFLGGLSLKIDTHLAWTLVAIISAIVASLLDLGWPRSAEAGE
jgi:hypothetical protein